MKDLSNSYLKSGLLGDGEIVWGFGLKWIGLIFQFGRVHSDFFSSYKKSKKCSFFIMSFHIQSNDEEITYLSVLISLV